MQPTARPRVQHRTHQGPPAPSTSFRAPGSEGHRVAYDSASGTSRARSAATPHHRRAACSVETATTAGRATHLAGVRLVARHGFCTPIEPSSPPRRTSRTPFAWCCVLLSGDPSSGPGRERSEQGVYGSILVCVAVAGTGSVKRDRSQRMGHTARSDRSSLYRALHVYRAPRAGTDAFSAYFSKTRGSPGHGHSYRGRVDLEDTAGAGAPS